MVHSPGVAQPDVNVFLKNWDRPGVDACVHAFVYEGGAVQTLPWNHRGWHAGTPRGGGVSANNTHISFEILEPAGHTYQGGTMIDYDAAANTAYFAAVYHNAAELAAFLCRTYGLDPLKDIVDHEEGYRLDIASNHSDVMQWFPKHGKSMDTFRADVKALLESGEEENTMTQEQFNAMLANAVQSEETQPVSSWAEEDWKKAEEAGLFDGTKPRAPLTREQAAVVLERLGLLK